MLPSVVVIASEVNSSRRREKICSGLTTTSFSICSFGSTVSPVTLTPETLYCSPSVRPAVMYMSRLSGLIATWVVSIAEIDVAAVEVVVVAASRGRPTSFSREYWSSRRYQHSQLLSRDSQLSVRFLLLERLVADQVDVADLGRLAFLDGDGDVDAVAVQPRHRRA